MIKFYNMKKCIICWVDISKTNQPFRCLSCYCNSDYDKVVTEYIEKHI